MKLNNIEIKVEQSALEEFPFNFKGNIENLLQVIPSEHLMYLRIIYVTLYLHGKKDKKSYGMYYGKREGGVCPTVFISATNCFRGIPKIFFYLMPFVPRFLLADVLYHEIGHHYQRISHGYKKERWERDANLYSRKMAQKYYFSRGIGRIVYKCRKVFLPILKKLIENRGSSLYLTTGRHG